MHSVASGMQGGNARQRDGTDGRLRQRCDDPVDVDVVIVDEAYQTTLSDMAVALRLANQVVLVGDPGQIGPVVTVDDSVWAKQSTSPTRRAPEMLAERPDAVVVGLDTTYRLGPISTELLNRLYDFPIRCGRSPRHVAFDPALDRHDVRTLVGGLPEVARLVVPTVVGRNESGYLRTVAETARSYVGRTVSVTTPEGEPVDYTWSPLTSAWLRPTRPRSRGWLRPWTRSRSDRSRSGPPMRCRAASGTWWWRSTP